MDGSSFIISLLSGAAAGTSTDLAFFPIDTVKTRLQAKGGFFHNGGWKGVYRGLGSAVVASAPSASLFFITYDSMKVYAKPLMSKVFHNEQMAQTSSHMVASSMGEIAACLVRVPAEVIKQRTQTHASHSSMQTFKLLLSNENGEGFFKNFYRGWNTTIMREIPFTCIQFPLYEYMKAKWAASQGKERVSPLQGALCGSISGGIAAAMTTPLDVLKTRIMLSDKSIPVFRLAATIYKEEGAGVFFRGVGPRTMWISAGGAIFLGVYETVSASLRSMV